MARPLRIQVPGGIYHITARGNARAAVFHDRDDFRTFLLLLGRVVSSHMWLCHGYCLLANHFHLLLETPHANLAHGMQRLNSRYAESYNDRYARSGHVFQGRYGSVSIEEQTHAFELARYLALNPVRAGICARPEEWPWSSYRALIGTEPAPPLLTTDWVLGQFGDEPAAARARFRAFVTMTPA